MVSPTEHFPMGLCGYPLLPEHHRGCRMGKSSGSHDSFTLTIGHGENERLVLDVCQGTKPHFNPPAVVERYAKLLKSYRVYSVTGDRYAGEWVREQFSQHGIHYRHGEQSKSELYLEPLPQLTQGAVTLLDYPPLRVELIHLECRTARSGKDSIGHPPGGRDDYANACCGLLTLMATKARAQVHMVKLTGW